MSLLSRINLIKRLRESRKFRDAYVYEHVRNGIPFQIRALRKAKNWSQSELADAAKTSRTVITRIEDPNYGKLTLKTLLAIASAFNVALLIKFVPFSRLLREYENVSWQALSVNSIADNEEVTNLEAWAQETASQSVIARTGTGKIVEFRRVVNTGPGTTVYAFRGDPGQAKFSFMYEPQPTISQLAITHPDEDHITFEDFKRANRELATQYFISKNVANAA